MSKARVLGIPHVEDGEIVFAVWVQRPSSAEIVRVTTTEPDTFYVEMLGHTTEVADLAREEVKDWIGFQQRFMDRLYARLQAAPRRKPIQSHVRDVAPPPAAVCALCDGTGESEKFLDRSDGHARRRAASGDRSCRVRRVAVSTTTRASSVPFRPTRSPPSSNGSKRS
jgi:hypothetical protein